VTLTTVSYAVRDVFAFASETSIDEQLTPEIHFAYNHNFNTMETSISVQFMIPFALYNRYNSQRLEDEHLGSRTKVWPRIINFY
jgi:F0F1-type ATP synthase gamma subunit